MFFWVKRLKGSRSLPMVCCLMVGRIERFTNPKSGHEPSLRSSDSTPTMYLPMGYSERADRHMNVRPTSRRRRSSARRARGAVVVEFALVLPILVALLVGITTSGIAYNKKLNLTYATREGARYGATVPPSQSWASGTWASNVRDLVVARSGGDLTAANVCV